MDILVVSQFYYPDEFRINDITRQMAADGHTVHVLTGLPDYATTRVPKEYRWFRRRRETVEGVDIIRVPIIARRHGALFRVLNYLSFVICGCLYARFCGLHPDLVLSYETSPVLQVLPAITMKKRCRVPLVIYCCDIWPECLKVWGVGEKSPLFRYIKHLSKKIFNAGDRVAYTSKPFGNYLHTVNEVPMDKIMSLPQHAEDLFGAVCGRYVENGVTDFLFAGNIGAAQGADCLVRAAARLCQMTDAPWHIHMLGDGAARESCEQLAAQLGVTDHITFHGKHPLSEMPEFYLTADCFLLTMSNDAVGAATLPAKWQGYAGAGKPILAAANGACADMMAQVGCGACVPAQDDAALAEQMLCVINDPEEYRARGQKGRAYYEANCTKERFMSRLYDIFRDVLGR